ncbi:hypothetical protein E1258_09495 [Micromonospora sp. KC207]|uniref:hypothetical protein n=1 Tax=Micromonospora sp. KC207 TaxID=2530377 RepID=UPI00104AEACC|nr:hypothetical protein [Micromonospora sp. KC207]TDC63870.1 hypothetical protein E1258_09495 [Micromonospora sp. KC207]
MTRRRITQQHIRDSSSVLLGLAILVHQAFVVPPGGASEILVLAGLTLLTGPAVGGVLGLRRDAVTSDASPSPSSPSSSLPSSSPPAASSGAGETR